MLLIFVDKITERLIYTLDFIFNDRGISYELTNDWSSFQRSEHPKFVYSDRFADSFLQLQPSTLLFDEALFVYAIEKTAFQEVECLSFNKVCDPLAAIFYVLTRYEEYLIKQRDEHERFEAKNSILTRFEWLEKVVCDRWAEAFILYLENALYCRLKTKEITFHFIPSFDIDNTFAFQWKEGIRFWLGKFRDKLQKDHLRIEAREAYQKGKIKDPYDTYDDIKAIANKGFDVKIFWLIGDYASYDKNISGNDVRHQQLIREMADFAEIGLHPSYQSNKSIYYLKNEAELLAQILKRKIRISRQHFLKLNLPVTYLSLIDLGFTDDYSMGYADKVGFRNGTARPYPFFDLLKNSTSELLVHPFAYMDGSLKNYLKLSPNDAKKKILELYREVKQFGGEFICLWHNETINDFGQWKGWKDVFEYTLALEHEI